MNDTTSRQLIIEISRDLIAQIAPQELPLFRAHSQAYFDDPAEALKQPVGEDGMLEFGVGDAVVFVTPIVLAIASEIVVFLSGEIRTSFAKQSADLVGDLVKKLFKRFRTEKEQPPALTDAQLAQVRKIAYQKARQLKIAEAQAALLADALVGGLAVTQS
jgi:hypothetical protein